MEGLWKKDSKWKKWLDVLWNNSLSIVSSVLIINLSKLTNIKPTKKRFHSFPIRLISKSNLHLLFSSETSSLSLRHLFLHAREKLHCCERSAGAIFKASFLLITEVTTSEVGDTVSEALLHSVVHHSKTDLNGHFVHLAAWHIHG